ncbi:MAG: aminopeptidase [Bacilli bacterium]|nr:aminopeptidase [Bacilli bacterium]
MNNFEKYAELLLKKCLNMKSGQPLVITSLIECIDFVRVLTKKAYEMGVHDIYFDFTDSYLKYYQLLHFSDEEFENSLFWNKKIYDEYAKKDGAFLMLTAEESDIFKDVDPEKIAKANYISRTSRPVYKEKQGKYEVAWCIAMVSTEVSSKKVFPNLENSKERLWDEIFKACLIDKDDPLKEWDKKTDNNKKNVDKLNSLNLRKLHYTNSLGTDFTVELGEGAIWCGADEKMPDGTPLIVNMPTEEIFTSPLKDSTNGIVYASKPLIYSNTFINNFWLKFENGKVVDFDSEEGKEVLETLINFDEGSCKLGEVALVEYDSPISNSGILFYNTLYDENAACHLALGVGFPSCYKNGVNMTKEELLEVGVNQSNEHTDFMIGTSDLKIVGTTASGEEVLVFENGNFAWN